MDGWVFLDKPKNITSFKVIQRLRKILDIKKIGHAGTLDPFATGILAIAIGEADRLQEVYRKPLKTGLHKGPCLCDREHNTSIGAKPSKYAKSVGRRERAATLWHE